MKVVIQIDYDEYSEWADKMTIADIYENFYKNEGWILGIDETCFVDIYCIVDIPFMPIEGQRIMTMSGFKRVKWAMYNPYQNDDTPLDEMNIIIVCDE